MRTLAWNSREQFAGAHLATKAGGTRPLTACHECPIRPFSVCSVLNAEQLATLEALGQEVTFRPRAVLFMQGYRADAVFSVTSGVVRLFQLSSDGGCQVVGFALPGDFLGLPPDQSYSVSADAAGPVTACRFPRNAFSRMVEDNPDLLRSIHDSTVRQLEATRAQMVLLGRSTAGAKVASFLIEFRGRWSQIHGGSAFVPLSMRRQDIGDLLGLSIATVSRTLTSFERNGLLLIVPNGIRIRDITGLARVAEG